MLYNESTGKTDLFSVRSLVKWLETKPASDRYSYCDGSHCLIAQYLKASGYPMARVGSSSYNLDARGFSPSEKLPQDFHDIAMGGSFMSYSSQNNHTFGAALRRAKEYL